MRKFVVLLLAFVVSVVAPAQKSKSNSQSRQKTTTTQTQKKKQSQTTTKKQTKPLSEREKMQASQKQLRQDIENKKKQNVELDRKVKQQMQDVEELSVEIDDKKRLIDTIKTDIASLDSTLVLLNAQMDTLQRELKGFQERYANSVRYMYRNRKSYNKAMFVFSADNVNQMYRRSRFMKEYATYQKVQGETVKQKQAQVSAKQHEIESNRHEKRDLLQKGQREQQNLEQKQAQQKQLVEQLQKEQRTVQALIKKEQQQEAELNAKIEKLIAEEIAREQARIEAEKKRKAEELARKERERKERERKLAEAKAKEEAAKAQARAAKTDREKAEANRSVKNAEAARKTAERDVAATQKEIKKYSANSDRAKRLTGSFASNKGKLPMPITGPYKVIRGFGSNVVEGLGNVHLSSKGLYLKGQAGAMARCVFDGEVSKVYSTGSSYIVMVRHGKYISVYCDLASVSVSAGQKVSINQTLGKLGPSYVMQFQLRNWTDLLNPRPWLKG
jgi:septal ring factor EnvC (AmiA/AmiB activator)